MSNILLKKIYESRPFKTRNADEFDLTSILDLFVDPTEGLSNPFDFENMIIKGRMGTGKTMYLKANYAYYLYTLIPSMLENDNPILPIYIKLSDFQSLASDQEIYNAIIVKIIESITSSYLELIDAEKMANIHKGFQNWSFSSSSNLKVNKVIEDLGKMTSTEYVERSRSILTGKMGGTFNFAELSVQAGNEIEMELKKDLNPSIDYVSKVYEILLKPYNGKLIILLDEVGSISRTFFKEECGMSLFEVLMNQLRTQDYIRTKIAVYPQTYSDILTETRYGDAILLQENVKNEIGYKTFLNRGISLVEKYIEIFAEIKVNIEDVFDIDNDELTVLEQLIYASNGNMRRYVHLLDLAMKNAYKNNYGNAKVSLKDVEAGLIEHAKSMEDLFLETEIEFLDKVVKTCRARNAYRFNFPYKTLDMQRYLNKSSEYNTVYLSERGTGRKGAVYEFDYAYAVYKDIPTHKLYNSEKIDKSRSSKTGEWIQKITKINDELIEHALISEKVEGKITFIGETDAGFIMGDDKIQYLLMRNNIIDNDKNIKIRLGTRTRFLPFKTGEVLVALYIEILS